ncbi:pyridoxamine 5'-phosphate oxidase family protein [Methanobacterium ferruginis]|uniref:pyridoxamine 5'-phosphate oxidase family protein n=1 Tax=Methanobacterium ferruginis TaxID=710191 RepID=UPI002573CE8E|nr:pyridoxamine 5'-phosphate oxidase family protein [Methanobacterium ferruginis]BDZ66732.1 pyridoxamine 5'-phosphate oxidase [Methanobacterium ferruginis]
MKILKIPSMNKNEYDMFINEQYVSRIAFKGDYPYIAPFLYVFDGKFIYFLSTKYGKKVELLQQDPQVAVEIENYEDDMSSYCFVTLQGKINEVDDEGVKLTVRKMFVDMIQEKDLSPQVLAALGHSPEDPLESLIKNEHSSVWKLVDVQEIVALKNSQ